MKYHGQGGRHPPRDIDLIIVGRARSYVRLVSREYLMCVQMHQPGCCLMFQLFRMNVTERCLQESPQEREHTEYEAAGSHGFSLRYHSASVAWKRSPRCMQAPLIARNQHGPRFPEWTRC